MAESREPYLAQCPVGCNGTLEMTTIELPEGNLRRCSECGQLLSHISAAAYSESMQRFDRDEFNVLAPRQRERHFKVARRRLLRLSRLLRKKSAEITVLDVGCSRGEFLAAGTRLDFVMQGVEPAANVACAGQEAGLKIHIGTLEEIGFGDARFDAVTLFEVIEHLREPQALFNECHRVLKPGGLLVLSTGNTASWTARSMRSRWDYYHIAKDAGHISFYNPYTLKLLAARCRFEVARLETARVKFYEQGQVERWRYDAGKLAAELLNFPARLFRRGHDMLAFLRRA